MVSIVKAEFSLCFASLPLLIQTRKSLFPNPSISAELKGLGPSTHPFKQSCEISNFLPYLQAKTTTSSEKQGVPPSLNSVLMSAEECLHSQAQRQIMSVIDSPPNATGKTYLRPEAQCILSAPLRAASPLRSRRAPLNLFPEALPGTPPFFHPSNSFSIKSPCRPPKSNSSGRVSRRRVLSCSTRAKLYATHPLTRFPAPFQFR